MNLLILWKTTWQLFRKQSHSHHEIQQSHSWVQIQRTQPVCQRFAQMLTAGPFTIVKQWEPSGACPLGKNKDMNIHTVGNSPVISNSSYKIRPSASFQELRNMAYMGATVNYSLYCAV